MTALSRRLPSLGALLAQRPGDRFDIFTEPKSTAPPGHRSVMPGALPQPRKLRLVPDTGSAIRCALLARRGHDDSSHVYCDNLPRGHDGLCEPHPTAERMRLAWGTDYVRSSRLAADVYVGRHRP